MTKVEGKEILAKGWYRILVWLKEVNKMKGINLSLFKFNIISRWDN